MSELVKILPNGQWVLTKASLGVGPKKSPNLPATPKPVQTTSTPSANAVPHTIEDKQFNVKTNVYGGGNNAGLSHSVTNLPNGGTLIGSLHGETFPEHTNEDRNAIKQNAIKQNAQKGHYFEGSKADPAITAWTAKNQLPQTGIGPDEKAKADPANKLALMTSAFGNSRFNKNAQRVMATAKPGQTLKQALAQNQEVFYGGGLNVTEKDIEDWINQGAGARAKEYHDLLNQPVSHNNAKKFFDMGEKHTWGKNENQWYKSGFGKLQFKADDIRNEAVARHLLKYGGVLHMGAGHIPGILAHIKRLMGATIS